MISFGFSTIGCPDYDIDQVIAMAKDNGYSGVEIRFLRGTVDLAALAEFSPGRIRETRKRFDDAGIEVVGINTGVRMVSLDKSARSQQVDAARTNLGIAEALGAKYLRLFGGPLPADQDRETTLDAVAAGLGEIAEMTLARGVTSLIETHDSFCRSPSILDLYRRGANDSSAFCGIRCTAIATASRARKPGPRSAIASSSFMSRTPSRQLRTPSTSRSPGKARCRSNPLSICSREGISGYVNFEWEKG